MPRIYLLQLWFNLSDPAVEEALYDSAAYRRSTIYSMPVPGMIGGTMEISGAAHNEDTGFDFKFR